MIIPLKCIIIEDEPLGSKGLKKLIEKEPQLSLIREITDIEDIVSLQDELTNTDILFLDIRIQGGCLEEIADYLNPIPILIITSALSSDHFPEFIKKRQHYILPKPILFPLFDKCVKTFLKNR